MRGERVDYLEKSVQISVNIPPLSEPEAETYINLLFAELYLEDDALEEGAAHRTLIDFAHPVSIVGVSLSAFPRD